MIFNPREHFVGPMPVSKFLTEFIPEAPEKRTTNEIVFTHPSVSQNEDEFIRAIEASGLCPKLNFVDTSFRREGCRLKPDISVFSGTPGGSDEPGTDTENVKSVDRRAVQLWIVDKSNENDVFRFLEEEAKFRREKAEDSEEGSEEDSEEEDSEEEEDYGEDSKGHRRWKESPRRTCGQLIAHASALHHSQFRVFSFSVALFGETGRLLRWDRSGAIFTESFNWASQPDTLLEFLWRFNFLSDVDRGHDTTVTSVPDEEAEVALSKLKTYRGLEKIKKADLHKILVRDDRAADGELRHYIAPCAVWCSGALIGRSTSGYIAYDITSTELVYIKDYWRNDFPRIQKEADVYRVLHDAQVPNIPSLGPAGDVPLSPEHANSVSFAAQRTRTQDYVETPEGEDEWHSSQQHLEPHVHYRLVLETIGRPLDTFKSTRQLCEAIRDAIVAHSVAYEKAGILHRDVSAGNILISETGSGILIDWHLSKKVSKCIEAKPRQYSRTGTWQFMSISRLLEPRFTPHDLADDLESFFWVLLYQIVRCRKIPKINLSETIQKVFDDQTDKPYDGLFRGGEGKLLFLKDLHISHWFIELLTTTPCKDIIEEFRSFFNDLYLHAVGSYKFPKILKSKIEAKREQDPRVKDAREKLRSSEWMLWVFNHHLAAKWDVKDDGSFCKTEFRLGSSAARTGRKRKATTDSDDGRTTDERRRGRMPPSSTPSWTEDMFSI
ncbi:hypothetical protein B0F90DRAFT_1014957 [Multifurca ochricompacta]|uniref:Protein kinase domain-containing protein n=1 Tax=Multifurca ochricompacta TaxID=376703 RepID=A0AAD4M050_9AGAM|nr:hypothetical protein B0F90DRAFT_1014957 [Multifurca ochricompacta]